MKRNIKKIGVMILIFAMLVAALGMLTACGKSASTDNGEVRVYSLGDYIDPDLVGAFEKETGIKVVLDTFDTNEEMYPVISKGSVDYDVICTSDYMIARLISEGLLQEIDFGNVSNIENIESKYMDMSKEFDPENKYSVPHTFGTLGIMYNTENIAEGELSSWKDLWNEKYSQQIVMPDSMRDNFAIALKALGYSINTMNKEELKAATEYMKEQKPLVYTYANDSARDLAIGGSADIAVVWSGEILYSQEENESLEFVLPIEGTEYFIDSWAIPAAAKNKENAEAWINFMLDGDTAVTNYEYLTYAIPNKSVIDMVSSDEKIMSYLFPEMLAVSVSYNESLKTLGPEGDDLYSQYWKEFKAE